MYKKVKVVIGQLGSPETPATHHVRSYLKEFLGDPRVVDLPKVLWWIILNLFVLPFRPKKSGEAYGRIWDGEKFPLIENTRLFAHAVEKHLDSNIELNYGFLLSEPRIPTLFKTWVDEDHDERASRLVILPQFPQYSEATIASVVDAVGKTFSTAVNIPDFEFISSYHRLKAFIDLGAKKIQEHIDKNNPDDLIISFHGIPLRRVTEKKDDYYFHCWETFYLLSKQINFDKSKIHFCFQSRFGSEQWLGPATDEFACDLAKSGSKTISIYCPSFVVDCLETTDEIGNELAEEVEEFGAHIDFVPCLNDDEDWALGYANYINTMVNLSKADLEKLFYQTDKKVLRESLPEQVVKSPPLSKDAKSTVKVVFLTLFLDLIGFSIIFPLFPSLAKHYLTVDSENYFLQSIFGALNAFTSVGGASISGIVLFGGVLGALYSVLQFVAAPIWGALSDRYGRKPILVISVFGLLLSYVLWFFSGSFTLLLLARLIGGIMGGNLSAASAAVADVTNSSNRSKGMAFVGIAFALGFIFGPAIGGLLSLVDLTALYPSSITYGVNPFSMPALFAAVLSLLNLYLIVKNFKETLPKEKRKEVRPSDRSANPFKIFKPLPYKEVNLTNYAYFFFITAFSGMEFTLTFLALERLGYSSLDNAYMFIFIGFTIALVQGGYVRRKANLVGEKKMARNGMLFLIPGLLLIAYASNSLVLYIGLFFLSVGSSMAIPTLTSLVSLYTPESEQGRSLGIFRSLGSLGRVFGPIIASLVFWKYGSTAPYLLGAISLLLPILIIKGVPEHKDT
jgi:ferrochelatase